MKTALAVFEIDLGLDRMLLHMNEQQYRVRHVWDSPRHNNADYELHVILRGSCDLDVEDQTYPLRENQAVLIAPGRYHRPMQHPGEFELFSVSFSLPEGPLLKVLRMAVPVCRTYSVSAESAALCRSIFYESAAGNPYRHEMMQAQLTQLMLSSFRTLELSAETQFSRFTANNTERIRVIDIFFEDHLADKAGEEALAAALHLSRRQLSRVLKECYGMGFREKLIQSRMDSAAWMLRCTDKRISQIASEVGYSSEAAFYQVFRARFEMTPTEYRSRHRKNTIRSIMDHI